MTEYLQHLVEQWSTEVQQFDLASASMLHSCRQIGRINKMIYEACQKEGIDIDTLNLRKPTIHEPEQQSRKIHRVRKVTRSTIEASGLGSQTDSNGNAGAAGGNNQTTPWWPDGI